LRVAQVAQALVAAALAQAVQHLMPVPVPVPLLALAP
jgi:hypothetical protein